MDNKLKLDYAVKGAMSEIELEMSYLDRSIRRVLYSESAEKDINSSMESLNNKINDYLKLLAESKGSNNVY